MRCSLAYAFGLFNPINDGVVINSCDDYICKLHVEGNWIDMPALESLQDFENCPEFTDRVRGDSQVSDR